jgi:HTH-type transcriptional regulator / antitoxin HipB
MGPKSSRSPELSPTWAVALGAEVKRRRTQLRLTQKELADLASCGPDFLYDLERGKPTVRLDKLVPVLEVLGLRFTLSPRPTE